MTKPSAVNIHRTNPPDWFKQADFGIIIHWGPYSVPAYAPVNIPDYGTLIKTKSLGYLFEHQPYAEWYGNSMLLPNSPVAAYHRTHYGNTSYADFAKTFKQTAQNVDVQAWATAFANAGAKYVVIVTKHHDGFAMFDTQESDYKITSSKTPFSKNPKADVTKEIFNTFRKEGFKIGAYFSKPDWHSDDYWWSYFPPKDRNVNYDPKKYPEKWNSFKNFTFNQLNEITSNYGKIDILWLDGGWVRPFNTIDQNVEWQRTIKVEQDIDMDKIGTMARKNQPGIIIVDRTVPGKWENYVTPEQAVPEKALSIPWESCITMGDSFSYVPNDNYKSSQKIIETLVKIISRGGNYLMNIAPGPNGDYDPIVYERLNEISGWIDKNQSAVFATRSVAPYHDGNFYYTQSKDGKTVNIFHLDDQSNYQSPSTLNFTVPDNFKPKSLKVLGLSNKIQWKKTGNSIEIHLPKERNQLKYSTVIQITQ